MSKVRFAFRYAEGKDVVTDDILTINADIPTLMFG